MTISMRVNKATVEIWKYHPITGEDFKKRSKKGKRKGEKDRRKRGREGWREEKPGPHEVTKK